MNDSVRRLRVGVVGRGLIARGRHIPAFRRLASKVQLASVCDTNQELARETAASNGVPKAYQTLSEMLREERLDLVDICVPPRIHRQLAMEALEAGCHLLIEKPMAITVAECDEMIQAAHERQLNLTVVHNNVFHPPFIRAKEIAASGELGEIVGMEILLSTPRAEMLDNSSHWYHNLPGGMVGETGPHVAYMALEFLRNPVNVTAIAWNRTKTHYTPFDDYLISISDERTGCSARLIYSSECRRADVRIIGTKEMIDVDLQGMMILRVSMPSMGFPSLGIATSKKIAQLGSGLLSNAARVALNRYHLGTETVIERFVDCLVHGGPPPVTPERGREAVRIVEAIAENLQKHYPDRFRIPRVG